MKSTDVKPDCFPECNVYSNEKDTKLQAGNHVRTLECKTIFAKGDVLNWSEEVFAFSKTKNTAPWTYFINDLNGEKFAGNVYEKELQKTNQEEFRIEKLIKRKGNKLYDKWKGYDKSFNISIGKEV